MATEWRTGTLVYPSQYLSPEDFLHFVETDEFSEDWEGLGLNVEWDLWALQTAIMVAPTAAPVIKGTGGLRKVRYAPESWNCGKSGAARVCYAYFPEHWTVLLVMAYGKGAKETISPSERIEIKKYLESVQRYLDTLNY